MIWGRASIQPQAGQPSPAPTWGGQLLALLLWCHSLPCPSAGQLHCVTLSFQVGVAGTLAMSLELHITVLAPCHLPWQHCASPWGKLHTKANFSFSFYTGFHDVLMHCVCGNSYCCFLLENLIFGPAFLGPLSSYRVVWTIFRWQIQGHMNATLSVPPCLLCSSMPPYFWCHCCSCIFPD